MNQQLLSKSYKLPLKHPFTTSRYTVTTQETVIVSISNGQFTGYGEATVNPYYCSTIEKLQSSIESVRSFIENVNDLHPEQLWSQIEPLLRNDYFALCAIDCAYWDFYSKLSNKTMRSYWSAENASNPLSNYTIGIDTIEKMKQKICEIPWPIYKIKLGTAQDVMIVSELRKITDSIFRIDANCAWTVEETIENAKELQKLNVEFIEQPLRADDHIGMKYLKKHCVLPLIADESCQRLIDVEHCSDEFHGINIKLMKCGGITPALKMIKKARRLGLDVMAGCMTESSIGISNLVQLAPLLDYLDADGAMLIKSDISNGIKLINGCINYVDSGGSGATLK